ncbi:hypothetical protein ABW21_db0206188 [Orbilia brochopaga]|nr:hypothetical protein ABW21_db0206188 [Drechslerella brochopaga]
MIFLFSGPIFEEAQGFVRRNFFKCWGEDMGEPADEVSVAATAIYLALAPIATHGAHNCARLANLPMSAFSTLAAYDGAPHFDTDMAPFPEDQAVPSNSPPKERSKNGSITNASNPKRVPHLPYNAVLTVTRIAGLISASFATISDCDEVFNYWEPTHYLSHGYGLQTWEYSPRYAIRSWLYAGLHSLFIWPFSRLMGLEKANEFLVLRCILATIASTAQTELYDAISTHVHPDVGLLFLFVSFFSAGMFQAMPAFLPSSFAMSFVMLGTSAFLKTKSSPTSALVYFSIAGLLGWPFSLALVLPQLSLWALYMAEQFGIVWASRTLLRSIRGPVAVLALITIIDSLAYRKLVFVPFNIILYNVFGGEGRGPDLYGTEPWWYYLANLSLNFNVMLVAALCSGPFVV